MGQCVMKDCGLSNDKLTSPQKKNLRVFLTEVNFSIIFFLFLIFFFSHFNRESRIDIALMKIKKNFFQRMN